MRLQRGSSSACRQRGAIYNIFVYLKLCIHSRPAEMFHTMKQLWDTLWNSRFNHLWLLKLYITFFLPKVSVPVVSFHLSLSQEQLRPIRGTSRGVISCLVRVYVYVCVYARAYVRTLVPVCTNAPIHTFIFAFQSDMHAHVYLRQYSTCACTCTCIVHSVSSADADCV